MLTLREKFTSTRRSEEGLTRDAASHMTARPTHYQMSYSGPQSRDRSLSPDFEEERDEGGGEGEGRGGSTLRHVEGHGVGGSPNLTQKW